MRADTRTTRKTAYRNSIYVQGNTAEGLKYCLRLNSHIVVSASRHIVTVREHAG